MAKNRSEHLDATQAKNPRPTRTKQCDGLLWWNHLKHASGVLYPFAIFWGSVLLCVAERGLESNSDLSEESQVKGGNKEESTHMQNWREEVRNEGRTEGWEDE